MDSRKYFIENPEDFRFFLNRPEDDFYVHVIGYHNLCIIPAQKFLRMQECKTMHFVLAGEGTLIIEGKKYHVEKNDVFYVDDKSTFAYYPCEENPWEYVFFEFYGKLANSYLETAGLSTKNPVIKLRNAQEIESMLAQTFLSEQTSYFCAAAIFLKILDLATPKKASDKKPPQSVFIEELKSYIKIKYLDPDFSIENLCKTKFISHSHLCRIFKEKENMPVVSYVKKMRLEYAASLLKNTDYSLKKVCVMSGFKEYEYFFRAFKKHFGVTPTEYKNDKAAAE